MDGKEMTVSVSGFNYLVAGVGAPAALFYCYFFAFIS